MNIIINVIKFIIRIPIIIIGCIGFGIPWIFLWAFNKEDVAENCSDVLKELFKF